MLEIAFPKYINYLYKPNSINGLNLFAYCDNDPINMFDPSGCFPVIAIIGLVVASIAINTAIMVTTAVIETAVVGAATAIRELIAYSQSERIYEKYKDKILIEDGVIYGSSEVKNPFHIWALSAYVIYHTDSGAKGTSFCLAIEWICHNIGYNGFGIDRGKEVNFGRTIASDFKDHSSFPEVLMPIVMNGIELVVNPVAYIYDLVRLFI